MTDQPDTSRAAQTEAGQIQVMAEEVFDLAKLVWIAGSAQHQKDEYDLSESEFLTLDVLAKVERITVGELQRSVGVLPAQMSRLIRSLERKGKRPLVSCSLNPDDKRKIDVTITEGGRQAHKSYQTAKLATSMEVLRQLDERDRIELQRILRMIKDKVLNVRLDKGLS
jgi:DNA-binding MarR family transcriptional regulator